MGNSQRELQRELQREQNKLSGVETHSTYLDPSILDPSIAIEFAEALSEALYRWIAS